MAGSLQPISNAFPLYTAETSAVRPFPKQTNCLMTSCDFLKQKGYLYFLHATMHSLLKSRLIGLLREKGGRRIMCHGVLIQLSGQGILITGDSGIGKTACSLELASRGGLLDSG